MLTVGALAISSLSIESVAIGSLAIGSFAFDKLSFAVEGAVGDRLACTWRANATATNAAFKELQHSIHQSKI